VIRAAIIACLFAAPAAAQTATCMPTHADAVAFLAEKYGEVPTGYGLAADQGSLFEVFVSKSGSWTIVRVMPDGKTCALAGGYGWVFVESPYPAEGGDL
jgi:hypothetical protein